MPMVKVLLQGFNEIRPMEMPARGRQGGRGTSTMALTNQLTRSLQKQAADASTEAHKLKARTTGTQGSRPPKRSHSVELGPCPGWACP